MTSKWLLRVFGVGYVGFLVAVPVTAVVWRALAPGIASVWDSVNSPAGVHALELSLEVAAIAVALNTVFGVGVALVLARHRFPGATIVGMLVDLPLSLSPVVVGLALLLCYSSGAGFLGGWLAARGIMIIFSVPGIILASAFVSLPYVVREVLPVLQELGTDSERAAETLGAGPFTVFFRITLPAIRWGLTYGVLLTTARVLGEFGAVSVVAGYQTQLQTLTLLVHSDFENFDPAGGYAIALVLLLISIVLLAALSVTRSREERYQ